MTMDTLSSALAIALNVSMAALSCAQTAVTEARARTPSASVSSMALIHGGTFQAGIDTADIPQFQRVFGIDAPQLFQDEVPRHTVTVDDFYLDRNLVTNAQFRQFVDAHREWQASRVSSNLDNGNYLKQWSTPSSPLALRDRPVVNVNWYSAVAYCQWAGKRLPTEAEWEYAARGGANGLFPWGDQPVNPARANYSGSGLHTTSAVGSYPPNPYGLFDMAGNTWQFLADEWQPYPSAPRKNPVAGDDRFQGGPGYLQIKTRRVIRGGSYDGAPINLWVEYRDSHLPNGSRDFVGFRCAK